VPESDTGLSRGSISRGRPTPRAAESLADQPLERIRLIHPRREHDAEPPPFDHQPFVGLDAAQVTIQFLPKPANAEELQRDDADTWHACETALVAPDDAEAMRERRRTDPEVVLPNHVSLLGERRPQLRVHASNGRGDRNRLSTHQ